MLVAASFLQRGLHLWPAQVVVHQRAILVRLAQHHAVRRDDGHAAVDQRWPSRAPARPASVRWRDRGWPDQVGPGCIADQPRLCQQGHAQVGQVLLARPVRDQQPSAPAGPAESRRCREWRCASGWSGTWGLQVAGCKCSCRWQVAGASCRWLAVVLLFGGGDQAGDDFVGEFEAAVEHGRGRTRAGCGSTSRGFHGLSRGQFSRKRP